MRRNKFTSFTCPFRVQLFTRMFHVQLYTSCDVSEQFIDHLKLSFITNYSTWLLESVIVDVTCEPLRQTVQLMSSAVLSYASMLQHFGLLATCYSASRKFCDTLAVHNT